MKRLPEFLYSLVSYAVGMGGLIWFILYQGDYLIANTINSGTSVHLAEGLPTNICLMLLWGAQHSIMARPGFKAILTNVVPPKAERSTYLLAS